MSQFDSTLLVNKTDDIIMLPCLCGDTEEHVVFHYENDPEWNDFIFFDVQLGTNVDWMYRLKNAWRYLKTGRTYASMSLNRKTVEDMAAWLNKKLAESEKTKE